jgi:two-component system sensor histidine kinase/response regulator
MEKRNILIYGLVALFLLLTILSTVFPILLSGIFLCSTLAVASVTMVAGFRAGFGFYIIAAIILFLLPLREILGQNDFVFRFFGFTLAAFFLSILSHRLRVSERERNDRMALMSAIVESSDDAIIGKDLNGLITSWNHGAEELYGYTAQEIIGKPVTFLFPPDKVDEEQFILEKIKSGERLAHFETVRKKKNGIIFPVSLTVSPIKDSTGKIVGASKIARDITDRKRYEENLAKNEERYRTFIENSEEAIWMIEYKPPIDIDLPVDEQIRLITTTGVVGDANPAMAGFYGFKKPSDAIGREVISFVPPSEEGKKILTQWIANNYTITNYESRSVDDKGHTRYGATSFKGIIKDGKILRAWAVQRETTEQKLQQQELVNSEERYKNFIESSEFAIWRNEFKHPISTSLPQKEQIDKFFEESYIAEANKATLLYLNPNHVKDVVGKPMSEVGTRTAADDRFMKLFIENGYIQKDFESSEIVDGKERFYSSSMIGVVENGLWIRAWVMRRDITPQKEYVVEKEKLLAASEKAKRELEIASIEKDRFLANLSHELRTPLVSILGYSSMLLEVNPDAEQAKRMIVTINKNAKLQLQLIEDLLDLSKIISGKLELKKDYFKVNELANDSIQTLKKQADDKGLKIVELYETCDFYGDKKRLSQVFLNLLSNAVKFTDKGEIRLCIKCTDKFLTIKVRDTGIGIAKENFKYLFQPFKQLDSSSTRSKQGMGLGLSIVKNIVELHGGKVVAESKIGEGSEFTVFLPVMHAPEVITGQKVLEVTKSVDFKNIKMLLVEDDPDSAGFIKYLYEQKGAHVDWVESAKHARELIKENHYDLYIFDLSMPEEDGLSLIKSLRALKDTTKAVALTAFADTYYEKTALEGGFDMFLKKPSSLAELLSVIKLLK